jgi:hypothetical protein
MAGAEKKEIEELIMDVIYKLSTENRVQVLCLMFAARCIGDSIVKLGECIIDAAARTSSAMRHSR